MIIRIFDPTEPGLQACMYLTPPPQRFREEVHILLLTRARRATIQRVVMACCVGAAIACAPASPVRQVQSAPEPPPRDSLRAPPTPVLRSLRAEQARFLARALIITHESLGTGGVISDTLVLEEQLSAQLLPAPQGSVTLTLQSDSGYRLPVSRAMAPELAAQPRRRVVVSSLVAARDAQLSSDTSAVPCQPVTSLVSRILAGLWLRAALNSTSEPPMQGDSLVYRYCQTGVQFRTAIGIRPKAGVLPVSDTLSVQLLAAGSFTTDSNQVLPMAGAGTISATLSVRASSSQTSLFDELVLQTISVSSFQSQRRKQVFTQQTDLRLMRQND